MQHIQPNGPRSPDGWSGIDGIDGIDGIGAGKPHECSSLEKAGRPRGKSADSMWKLFGSAIKSRMDFPKDGHGPFVKLPGGYRSILSSFVLEFKDAMIGV